MRFQGRLIASFSLVFALFAAGMVVAARHLTGGDYLFFSLELFAAALGTIVGLGSLFGRSVRHMRDERTQRLKREMTGNIAHELRTPVTSIRGFLEIVLERDLDDARRREYLQRAYNQTQTLSSLISDMSLLARIDEKQASFEFTTVDAAGLIGKVRSDASSALAEKHIRIATHIPKGLAFRGNESLLYSVFRNLVDNVVSHAGEGTKITIAVTPDGTVVFSDNGRGIADPRHLERIFERFYRVGEGRTRDTGGSGLGLSIVRNTIALHGGEISVQRNHPSGLEFTFNLPVR